MIQDTYWLHAQAVGLPPMTLSYSSMPMLRFEQFEVKTLMPWDMAPVAASRIRETSRVYADFPSGDVRAWELEEVREVLFEEAA